MGTPTLRPPHADPSFPHYSGPLCDVCLPTLSTFLLSPTNSHSHIVSVSVPPLYITSHGPTPLLPSFSTPLISSPRVDKPSAGCDTRPPNRYYYMWWCAQGKGRNQLVLAAPHWPKFTPYLPQSSVVDYTSGSIFPLQDGTSPTHSGNFYASTGGGGWHSDQTYGRG